MANHRERENPKGDNAEGENVIDSTGPRGNGADNPRYGGTRNTRDTEARDAKQQPLGTQAKNREDGKGRVHNEEDGLTQKTPKSGTGKTDKVEVTGEESGKTNAPNNIFTQ